MKRVKAPGLWLYGAAVVILLAVLLFPFTGWLARLQLHMLLSQPTSLILLLRDLGVKEVPGIDLSAAASASERPQGEADYASQPDGPWAYASAGNDIVGGTITAQEEHIERIRILADLFPRHRASLFARCLRNATFSLVHVGRDAEIDTYMTGHSSKLPPPRRPVSPEVLASYDQDALMGERLDPDNAYFPLMRAIGLFAAHKDSAGLDAIRFAGTKTRFEDYALDEAEAKIKRFEMTNGGMSVEVRKAIYAATLFPHYAQIRAAARFDVYKTAQMEAAGQTAQGLAIRHAMMHCGALMRAQSHTAVGSLVGIAVFATQLKRTGGDRGMSEAALEALPPADAAQRRLELYIRYLTRIKHPDEAAWVRAESAAGTMCKSILDEGSERGPLGVAASSRLLDSWILSMVVLANTVAMLLLCGTMIVPYVRRIDSGRAPAVIAAILCVLFIVLAWRSQWASALGALYQVLINLQASDELLAPAAQPEQVAAAQFFASPIVGRLAVGCLSLCVPLLTVAILALIGLIHRKRDRSIFITGLCGGGSALCLALALLYGVAVSATAREETRQSHALDRLIQNEGTYFAEIAGKTWPPAR